MKQFANIHKNQPCLVLATGPSAWAMLDIPSMYKLFKRMPIIAINRAMNMGISINYQISLDRIWTAFFNPGNPPGAKALKNYKYLKRQFNTWKAKYKSNWTMEEWISAYWGELNIDNETKNYFRLLSPHAPFIRFLPNNHARIAPYTCQGFNGANGRLKHGIFTGGLYIGRNTGITAIHLASLMGCNPIFLSGIDMEPPNRRIRPWERCIYARQGVFKGFEKVAKDLLPSTRILNLNPKTKLEAFPHTRSLDDSVAQMKKALHV